MKILIVDDEPLQRNNIAQMVQNSSLEFERILTSNNAISALDIIEMEQPEIVLTDICMPKMDGTELALRLHEKYPKILVVFITGHEDFKYAQAGIEAKVFDYILKPIDSVQTLRCIAKAQKSCLEEQKRHEQDQIFARFLQEHLRSVQQQLIESLLTYSVDQDQALLAHRQQLFQMDFHRYRLAIAHSIPTGQSEHPFEESYYYAYQAADFLHHCQPSWITLAIGGGTYIVVPLSNQKTQGENSQLLHELSRLNVLLCKRYHQRFHIAVSEASDDLRELKKLKMQTTLCIERMNSEQSNDLLFYEDINISKRRTSSMSVELESLHTFIRVTNSKKAGELLTVLFQKLRGQDDETITDTIRLIVSQMLLAMKEEGAKSIELQMQGEELIRSCCKGEVTLPSLLAFSDCVCNAVNDAQSRINNQLIEQVKEYINDHFAEPIGLNQAAANIQRSPTYISRLFSQQTNSTFTHVLTDRRMAEAKRLLSDTALSVAEIAAKTGYPNVRYFYRVFLAQVGMTANDYRNLISQLSEQL